MAGQHPKNSESELSGDSALGADRRSEPLRDIASETNRASQVTLDVTLESNRWRKRALTILAWVGLSTLKVAIVLATVAAGLWMVGVAQRSGWIRSGSERATQVSSDQAGEAKRYICPMMCVPPMTQPGRCPVCGMELVEATSNVASDGVSIVIPSAARRLIGIRTAMSTERPMDRVIRTIGSIAYDESRLATISAYFDGRLETMYADYVGVPVNEGDDLALIYSPQLYTAQTEFVSAVNSSGEGRFLANENLLEMATEKLSELGMSQAQIAELRGTQQAKSRIRIQSPQQGTVIEKSAVEGDYVKTGQKLYRVADLSTVWLMLDLFPDDAALVRFGQQVEAEISAAPGIVFTGRVSFIDPTVNTMTRSVRVRVEMLNLDGKLRPGDYATARIMVPAIPRDQTYDPALAGKFISPMHPQIIRDEPGECPMCGMDLIPTTELGFSSEPLPEQRVVTVPRDAVLMAGGSSVVYVETEPGRFTVRRVVVGTLTNEEAVISEGLSAGEMVATDGNFLIDSQMQLAGNPSLLDPAKAPRFPIGPLQLPAAAPQVLMGAVGEELDQAFQAYFEIQSALASDLAAPPSAVRGLVDRLSNLSNSPDLPDLATRHLQDAGRSAGHLAGSLDLTREAFRSISHALLRVSNVVRGPATQINLTHYYCPMVPGGGGDWMQPGDKLRNPYWGSAMLSCGELVRDMAIATDAAVVETDHPSGGDVLRPGSGE